MHCVDFNTNILHPMHVMHSDFNAAHHLHVARCMQGKGRGAVN